MDPAERSRCEQRARLTIDLCQLGEDVMRQTLRRRHPTDDDAAIEGRIVRWLGERPLPEIAGVLRVHSAWPSRATAGR
ncbi:MAG: hypothetical protein NVSMB47_16130 [Polyangiales bacterium]